VNVQDEDIAIEFLGDLDGSRHRLARVGRTIDGDQDVLKHINCLPLCGASRTMPTTRRSFINCQDPADPRARSATQIAGVVMTSLTVHGWGNSTFSAITPIFGENRRSR
jgi:hypothetical protein